MLNITHATKRFSDGKTVRGIQNVSFSVKHGEVVCVLGGSGSGKSTLLKVLAGLIPLDNGTFAVENKHLASYVSQDYTLWPHLSVLQNLTLAPRLCSKESEEKIEKEARKLLKRFGLGEYEKNYPHELSGGQRQRVALLRAVMIKPKVLLLDEITSALDPELTKSVLDLIRALAKDGYTMVIVTHHMSFAMSVADRIIFLKNGSILQDASTVEFFSGQSNPEIQSFILDIAKRDESIEVFRGLEQFQAYHLGMIKRSPPGTTLSVVGAVGDTWYDQMGDLYETYAKLRVKKEFVWKMVMVERSDRDRELVKNYPQFNQFRNMSRMIENPANFAIYGDIVITQIFEGEPTIIEIKNKHVAASYMRFFEELWQAATEE